MPNWCSNFITLKHKDPAMIERAIKAFENESFLNEFIPCPEPLKEASAPNRDTESAHELRAKYGYSDWYSFQITEWGTKWDIGSGEVTIVDPNTIDVPFDSAWSPPCTAYEKLVGMGFEIKAYYDEPGMAFCGVWQGTSEEDYSDEYHEYGGEDSSTVRDVIGEELDDFWCISERMADMEEESEDDEE
jgi:hypothetical protein